MTDNTVLSHLSLRMPAEWDHRMTATLIAWPHDDTDWAPMLADVDRCYVDLTRALLQAGQQTVIVTPEPDRVRGLLPEVPRDKVLIVKCETNDTWTRDYGPLTVALQPDDRLAAMFFCFNGWGLKSAQ